MNENRWISISRSLTDRLKRRPVPKLVYIHYITFINDCSFRIYYTIENIYIRVVTYYTEGL